MEELLFYKVIVVLLWNGNLRYGDSTVLVPHATAFIFCRESTKKAGTKNTMESY